MLNVKIDESTAFKMLSDRVDAWTTDREIKNLFDDMYERYIDGGCFDGAEFDPMVIVDNDYVNYCQVIDESDPNFEKIKKLYLENGCGCDVSCENVGYSFIESANDDDEPTLFLIRW